MRGSLAGEMSLAALVRATPGIDPAVADAVAAVPRAPFVAPEHVDRAEDDTWLPTGPGTTISQPSYVARMISEARVTPRDRVLEIGTGSGWTAAILARLAAEVVTVEHVPDLAASARSRLAAVPHVHVVAGDGDAQVDGTFDAILVMAGAPEVPPSYQARLRDGGRLIIPIGRLRNAHAVKCRVVRVVRAGETFTVEDLFAGDWNLLRGKDGF